MKKNIIAAGAVIALLTFLAAGIYFNKADTDSSDVVNNGNSFPNGEQNLEEEIRTEEDSVKAINVEDGEAVIAAQNLSVPWEIVFLPDDKLLITERTGTLLQPGEEGFSIEVSGVVQRGEGGLLGMALHPNFNENSRVYLYYTYATNQGIRNKVVRFTLEEGQLNDEKTIISDIPGDANHNGGRIAFGPDGFLYITTGDAGQSRLAQNTDSLAGKILRVGAEGEIPSNNPFKNAVFSYGHRNPQGLAWDEKGRLWATEHGRSGAFSGFDELNLINKGGNYGWPVIEGDEQQDGMIPPVIHSGAETTWAPAGLAFTSGRLFFTGLRGAALYEIKITKEGGVEEINTHFKNQFGRLRNVKIDSKGQLFLLTSNTDGRGNPRERDDKIIRIVFDRA